MAEIDNYNYELPPELIAQQPLPNRSDSRLMVVNREQDSIEHFHFRDLPEFLRSGDSLVLNDTRVVPAKLVGYRNSTGGRWQGLYLEHDENDCWKILCKTRGKLVAGEVIGLVNRQGQAAGELTLISRLDDGMWMAKANSTESTFDLLSRIGRVPLPHYIRGGEATPVDLDQYQTVFAREPGSVAAPTAGLHFTDGLLEQVASQGVTVSRVTLHVGIGTFRPVKVDRLEEHSMHSEWCELTPEVAEQLRETRKKGGRVIGVGTTTVRTLESAAQSGEIQPWNAATDIFIRPPWKFNAIDGLITNFHLPRSTLLVLVQTLAGDSLIKRAYQAAIEEEYRFFSYGDAMLII